MTESNGCKEGRILSVNQTDFGTDQEMHQWQTRVMSPPLQEQNPSVLQEHQSDAHVNVTDPATLSL